MTSAAGITCVSVSNTLKPSFIPCLLCAFRRGSSQAGSAATIAQNPKRMPLSRTLHQETRLRPGAPPTSTRNPSVRYAASDAAAVRMRWIFERDDRLRRDPVVATRAHHAPNPPGPSAELVRLPLNRPLLASLL